MTRRSRRTVATPHVWYGHRDSPPGRRLSKLNMGAFLGAGGCMCLLQHCAGARLSRDDEISYLISWPSPLVRAPRTQPGRLAAVLWRSSGEQGVISLSFLCLVRWAAPRTSKDRGVSGQPSQSTRSASVGPPVWPRAESKTRVPIRSPLSTTGQVGHGPYPGAGYLSELLSTVAQLSH
jgi:hypothetical protein